MKEEPLNKIYSDFLDQQRIAPPDNLSDDILRTLKTTQKRRLAFRATTAFAAAILAIVFVLTVLKQPRVEEMDYIDKVALLLEAKSMVAEENREKDNEKIVIYEDEELLIYFK